VIISGLPIADGKLHTPARGQGLMRMSLLGTDGAGPRITGTGNGPARSADPTERNGRNNGW
jgi:hypothetical protein